MVRPVEAGMEDVEVDSSGVLRCPYCGGASFDRERTGAGKLGGAIAIGVGVFLVPKRMHCLTCGRYSRGGNATRTSRPPQGSALGSRLASPSQSLPPLIRPVRHPQSQLSSE